MVPSCRSAWKSKSCSSGVYAVVDRLLMKLSETRSRRSAGGDGEDRYGARMKHPTNECLVVFCTVVFEDDV